MTVSNRQGPISAEEAETLRMRLREAEDTLEAIRQGSVDALVVKARDKQQIFTLKSADHTYRVLIESMNQGALTISQDGTVLYCNKQFSKIVGKPLNRITGSQIQNFFKPNDRPLISAFLEVSKGTAKSRELLLELDSKIYKAVLLSVTALKRIENNAYKCIVVTDMTERKQSSDAKDEFISLASHQLRTPATAVKQYLGMLMDGVVGPITEDQRIFVKTAYDGNERQLQIINDILRTARIDSGLYQLKRTRENVAETIQYVIKDFQIIFNMRQQKIVCNIEPDLYAQFDRVEMLLVLSNLIENASKYSPESTKITITAYQTRGKVYIEVADEGVGIADIDKQRIFEKFTRIDNTMSDTVSGNGLGLYWVKSIITMHGGRIEVKSPPQGGTTFVVSLPV